MVASAWVAWVSRRVSFCNEDGRTQVRLERESDPGNVGGWMIEGGMTQGVVMNKLTPKVLQRASECCRLDAWRRNDAGCCDE